MYTHGHDGIATASTRVELYRESWCMHDAISSQCGRDIQDDLFLSYFSHRRSVAPELVKFVVHRALQRSTSRATCNCPPMSVFRGFWPGCCSFFFFGAKMRLSYCSTLVQVYLIQSSVHDDLQLQASEGSKATRWRLKSHDKRDRQEHTVQWSLESRNCVNYQPINVDCIIERCNQVSNWNCPTIQARANTTISLRMWVRWGDSFFGLRLALLMHEFESILNSNFTRNWNSIRPLNQHRS